MRDYVDKSIHDSMYYAQAGTFLASEWNIETILFYSNTLSHPKDQRIRCLLVPWMICLVPSAA